MKFGIGVPAAHQGTYLPTPFATPADLARIVTLAERLGYYSAWGIDFMSPWDNPVLPAAKQPEFYEILVTLAFLAAQTSKIRFGTAALQLPLRDPFTVARQASTLDVLSNGRMLLGLGRGSARIEFERMYPRQAKSHRGRMFDEYLEVLHRFLTENAVTFDGKYYACDQLAMLPKPVQKPFPIYISGVTDEIYQRLAKYGTGWLLSRAQAHQLGERLDRLDRHLDAAGRHRDEIDLVVTHGLCIGKTREDAMARFQASVLPAKMDSVAASKNLIVDGKKPSQDPALIREQNLIGTLDDIIEQLSEIRDRKITHCVLYYNPVRNVQELCDQIQWFGEEIMPKFAR